MAIKQVKVSDLSEAEGADITAVVREYPGLDQPKALDITPAEMEVLVGKALTDLVVVELRLADSSTRDVMVKKADFDKWCSADNLKAARGTKGRAPGYSPKANGN